MKSDDLSPLVAATDPRFELRGSLIATRVAMENRKDILSAQIKQLDRELQACCDTITACTVGENHMSEALSRETELTQLESNN